MRDIPTDSILKLDATGQAELVHSGDIKATELVEAAIQRIDALNPQLNFLAGRDFDRALDVARESEGKLPFSGVPTLLKDTLSYSGLRYSMGSRLFADQTATVGSEYTDRIDASGLIVLGKSTTSEFAMLGSVETALEGITRNPWDPDRSPAGSSGGSATAVAAGIVPIAHASDGGGSIRIPASATGLFGLKPSRGRTVRDVPDGLPPSSDLISQHCLTRSVRDSARFLSLTERRGTGTPLQPVGYVDDVLDRKLRIGFYTETLSGREPDQEVYEAIQDVAELCADLGHDIVPCTRPAIESEEIGEAFFILAGRGLSELELMISTQIGKPVDDTLMEPFALGVIDWFRKQPEGSIERASLIVDKVTRTVNDFLDQFDVALCPTLPVTPRPIGHFAQELGYDELYNRMAAFAGYTPIHNQAGTPAMSVPLSWSSSGLPIGSHFAAPFGQEALLLQLAYQLEEARPWAHRWPALSA